jgi:hypothetical protein
VPNGMTLLAVGYHARVLALGGIAKRKGVSSRASLLGPWVPNSMTLLAVGYHARVLALGGIAKRKGVSSRASLLISVKVLVGNIATSGHQPRAMSLD